MGKINLLPKELTPKESFLKLASSLKKIVLIGFVTLIILTVALIGGFIVLSNQLNSAVESQKELKAKINAQKSTEQRLVLVKDRLGKIEHVLGTETATDEVESLEKLIAILPDGATLGETNMSPLSTSTKVFVDSSKTLVQFLAILLGSDIYSKVNLKSLTFSYISGYGLQLALIN